MKRQFRPRTIRSGCKPTLLELSIDSCRVHNRNVNAAQAAGFDRTKENETTFKISFVSKRLLLVLAFLTNIVAALVLSGCEQKTETVEPKASPSRQLASPSQQPTVAELPVATSTPEISRSSSPNYTGWEADERGVEDQEEPDKFPWPPPRASASERIPRELLVGTKEHAS